MLLPMDSIGERVKTVFGEGTVVQYRFEDEMFIVELPLPLGAKVYTKTVEPADDDSDQDEAIEQQRSMELNVAYEAYEKMRKLNLELECIEKGWVFASETPIDYDACTKCLIQNGPPKPSSLSNAAPALTDSKGRPLFPRLYKLRMEGQEYMKTNQKSLHKTKKQPPCLLCASPTCSAHSSKEFRREGITLCSDCVVSLEFDFDSNEHTTEELSKRAEHLVDLYDRAVLLLRYSTQFMLQVALQLDQSKHRQNHVGLGSSSAGLVSGALGVAAACTILSPAGPPLLIASLVFGGSATVVQTGSEAMRYYSEPSQLANRIMALEGITQTILHKTQLMRETTLLPYLDRAILALSRENASTHTHIQTLDSQLKQTAVTAGVLVGSTAATGVASLGTLLMEEGAVASRFISRAGTNLARTARLARFAGGALSAATVLLEARELTKTVDHIKRGSPCEKAQELRRIHEETSSLPPTKIVDAMSQSYVKVRSKQLAAKRLLDQQVELEDWDSVDDLELVEEVVSSLEASHHPAVTQRDVSLTVVSPPPRVDLSKSSLLQRVQAYKEREARAQAEVNLMV